MPRIYAKGFTRRIGTVARPRLYRCCRCKRWIWVGERITITVSADGITTYQHTGRHCPPRA